MRLIPERFRGKGKLITFIGALLTVGKAVLWLVERAGDVDFLISRPPWIRQILAFIWETTLVPGASFLLNLGPFILLAIGIGLWVSERKEHKRSQQTEQLPLLPERKKMSQRKGGPRRARGLIRSLQIPESKESDLALISEEELIRRSRALAADVQSFYRQHTANIRAVGWPQKTFSESETVLGNYLERHGERVVNMGEEWRSRGIVPPQHYYNPHSIYDIRKIAEWLFEVHGEYQTRETQAEFRGELIASPAYMDRPQSSPEPLVIGFVTLWNLGSPSPADRWSLFVSSPERQDEQLDRWLYYGKEPIEMPAAGGTLRIPVDNLIEQKAKEPIGPTKRTGIIMGISKTYTFEEMCQQGVVFAVAFQDIWEYEWRFSYTSTGEKVRLNPQNYPDLDIETF